MKNITFVLLYCLVVTFTLFPARAATRYLIAMPGSVDEKTSPALLKAASTLILKCRPHDQIEVFDAQKIERIAVFEIPDAVSPQARVNKLAGQIALIKQHLQPKTGATNDIRLPQMLAAADVPLKQIPTRILVFGSAYYRDSRDAAAVFAGNQVPTDGSISASSEKSLYGCAGREKLLSGACVDFCALDISQANELTSREIGRFWTLYVAHLGGTLTTISSSPDIAVDRCFTGIKDPATPAELSLTDRAIGIREVAAPPVILITAAQTPATRPTTLPSPPATETPELPSTLPQLSDGITIGIAWNADDGKSADVDLWVNTSPRTEELCFGHIESADGKYIRDIRFSDNKIADDANWRGNWECVELKPGIQIGQIDVWVNRFECQTNSKIHGVVRIQRKNKVDDIPFEIQPGSGDKAQERGDRNTSRNWVKVDVARIISIAQ